MSQSDWIATTGVTLLLVAFALNIGKKLGADSKLYLLLNVVGAGLACISSYLIGFWPFVVLEGVWALASLIPLLRTFAR